MRAFVIACLLALSAPAQAVEYTCVPTADIVAEARKNGATVRPLEGDPLVKATLLYNSSEPKTDEMFDTGAYALNPNGTVILFYGRGETICTYMLIQKAAWPRTSRFIFGEGV
jgi:hypothetical protein